MEYSNLESRIKNIVYNYYSNVFDFDIKSSINGGDELKVTVTFRTSLSQLTPMRVVITLKRDGGEYSIKRVYVTKSEKLAGLREAGRVDEFVSRFLHKEWNDGDIVKFIEDNKDIIKDSGAEIEKEDIISLLEITKEQRKR